MNKGITAIIIVLVGLFIVGSISSQDETSTSDNASTNTARNSFVSACKQEAQGIQSLDSEVYCQCAFDEMLNMYPDFITNKERLNRIGTTGYNATETDKLVTCMPKAERKNV